MYTFFFSYIFNGKTDQTMEEDISTDAIGIPPRLPEDTPHVDTRTKNNEQLSMNDHQEHNNYLPPPNVNSSFCSEHDNPQTPRSEKEFHDISSEQQSNLHDLNKETTDETSESTEHTHETNNKAENHEHKCGKEETIAPRMKDLCLPPEPPREWRLNQLLDQIASNINENEFERMKMMFAGNMYMLK